MDIKFMNQPKEVKLGEIIKQRLEAKFDEVWIVSGFAKDSGFEYLIESFENAVNNGVKINVFVGVDRKNTSKDNLLKILTMGANLSIHVNTEEEKDETRIYVFESNTGDSYIYISGGKFSEGGLLSNSCLITEIKYSQDDNEKFKVFKHQLAKGTENVFKSVDREDIILLAKKGEILTRIIDRKIPSINELYGNKEQIIGETVYDEGNSKPLFNINELENIDIEFEDGISVRSNVKLSAEKEATQDIFEGINKTGDDLKRLLNNGQEEEKDNKKTKIIKDVKELDYNDMTTLIIEAGKIAETGADAWKIKMPRSLASNLTKFFNLVESGETIAQFEIMDNRDGKEYGKREVKLNNTSKGLAIIGDDIRTLELSENDILRIVKIDESVFRCEIIREKTQEYDIWEKYCTNNVRGTERRYGII